MNLIKVLTTHQHWHAADVPAKKRVPQLLETLLADEDVRVFLKINLYNEIEWYNKEAFEQLLWGLFAVAVIDVTADEGVDPAVVTDALVAAYDVIKKLQDAQADSEYQVEKLKAAVTPAPASAGASKADAQSVMKCQLSHVDEAGHLAMRSARFIWSAVSAETRQSAAARRVLCNAHNLNTNRRRVASSVRVLRQKFHARCRLPFSFVSQLHFRMRPQIVIPCRMMLLPEVRRDEDHIFSVGDGDQR